MRGLIDDGPSLLESSSAQGQNRRLRTGQARLELRELACPEPTPPLFFHEERHGAMALDDELVQVQTRCLRETAGQLTQNCGFSSAAEASEQDMLGLGGFHSDLIALIKGLTKDKV